MKLTILGGGGFRVPLVYRALLSDPSSAPVTELRLYDSDELRLRAIEAVLRELEQSYERVPNLVITTDLRVALEGTDFVFSAIRVGGTQGRALDEQISLRNGVIGQETVGAGGISYALRGIPAVLDIVDGIRAHAPDAWVINFTNPAGVITEVMQRYLGDRVIGICDSPVGLARRVVSTLQRAGLAPKEIPELTDGSDRVAIEYVGLNHLGWLTGLVIDDVDILPRLLERPDLIESFEEGRLFGADLVQALGAVPNEYLHYYYYQREDLAVDSRADATRGVFLSSQQAGFYSGVQGSQSALALWEATRLEREATYMASNREASGSFERDKDDLETGGYDRVALAIMHAIASDEPADLILNVANRGSIPELDDEAVVEIPCRVDADGVHRLPTPALPGHARGMVVNAKYVERRTIAAALEGSYEDAVLALAHHPLIDSVNVARSLLRDLIDSFAELNYLKGVSDVQ